MLPLYPNNNENNNKTTKHHLRVLFFFPGNALIYWSFCLFVFGGGYPFLYPPVCALLFFIPFRMQAGYQGDDIAYDIMPWLYCIVGRILAEFKEWWRGLVPHSLQCSLHLCFCFSPSPSVSL